MKKINLILLIDDNDADNTYHRIIISATDIVQQLVSMENSRKSLDYLRSSLELEDNTDFPVPDLIFLDINMPAMNGFELLDELREISDTYGRKSKLKIFMLTGSLNPDDFTHATENYNDFVNGFCIKPLTEFNFAEIVKTYF